MGTGLLFKDTIVEVIRMAAQQWDVAELRSLIAEALTELRRKNGKNGEFLFSQKRSEHYRVQIFVYRVEPDASTNTEVISLKIK